MVQPIEIRVEYCCEILRDFRMEANMLGQWMRVAKRVNEECRAWKWPWWVTIFLSCMFVGCPGCPPDHPGPGPVQPPIQPKIPNCGLPGKPDCPCPDGSNPPCKHECPDGSNPPCKPRCSDGSAPPCI